MKWTPVDSHGLDVVLKPLANERGFGALEKLQHGSYGLAQIPSFKTAIHIPLAHFRAAVEWLLFAAGTPVNNRTKAARPSPATYRVRRSRVWPSGGPAKWL